MNRTSRRLLCAGIVSLSCLVPAHADISGGIDVSLVLLGGCFINGVNTAEGTTTADFGSLDFGTHTTLFERADAAVVGLGGGVSVQCTSGVSPVLEFGSGLYDGAVSGSTRAMLNGTVGSGYVGYGLYTDPDRTDEILPGRTVTLPTDGSVQVVSVYGRAVGAAGLSPGAYADVVTVTVEL